jgi:plastocyanin
MKALPSVLLAAVATGAAYAFLPLAGTAQTAAPSAVPSASASASAAAVVDTKNFAYAPATITIHPGQTVTFKNSDTIAHTVTAADKSFDSGNMDQGATWSHIFAKAGTYAYVCAYHSYMTGTVIVK